LNVVGGGLYGEDNGTITWTGSVNNGTEVVVSFDAILDGGLNGGELITNTAVISYVGGLIERSAVTTVITDSFAFFPLVSLYKRLVEDRESFWAVVYPLYMQREITRGNVRDLVRKGLEEARGNYKIVARIFNMDQGDYKKFLNFLRKHECQVPFKEYR
jgi:hypothetical protein